MPANSANPPLPLNPVIVECPRDAMQGWGHPISTEKKVEYLNALLRVGFDTIDFGSFVSPKLIPQMADTAELLSALVRGPSLTRLLAIVANIRGAETAAGYGSIDCLGYPFSVSETFQKKNTHHGLTDSLNMVKELIAISKGKGKELVIYLSMGFGNPYGDPYSTDIVAEWVDRLANLGIGVISLADTVGVAVPKTIRKLFAYLIPAFPQIRFGAHFHSQPSQWLEKVQTADLQGCRRFDTTLLGIGGCPMAGDELVGNIATENLIQYFRDKQVNFSFDEDALREARLLALQLFR